MTAPENQFQRWVWKGLEENFSPDGDLKIDGNDDDVFIGILHVDEDSFEVEEHGPVVAISDLPLSVICSLQGQELGAILALPSCGDPEMDAVINSATITSVAEKGDRYILAIGA